MTILSYHKTTKCAVEMPIIEQQLARMKGRSRWIPHNSNPSDALTKLKGAHMAPMMELLKTGFYHLKQEEAQLKERADQKEKLGAAPRLKQSAKQSQLFVGFNLLGISSREERPLTKENY